MNWTETGVPSLKWSSAASRDLCDILLIETSVCQHSLTAQQDACLLWKGVDVEHRLGDSVPPAFFLLTHLHWWVWLRGKGQPAQSPPHPSSVRLINRTQGKVTLSNDYFGFLRYIIMMVLILEGIGAIIPRLTQHLESGSFFSIILEVAAMLLNPKICVLVKTPQVLFENDNVDGNFSCTFHFYDIMLSVAGQMHS